MTDLDRRQHLKMLAGGASLMLAGCSGGSSASPIPSPTPTSTPTPVPTPTSTPTPDVFEPAYGLLRDTYRNNFKVGAAFQSGWISGLSPSVDIVKSQFSSITAEFEMQPYIISPTEGVYNFTAGDALVAFAQANNLEVRGHSLLWHETAPDYFFRGTKAEIKARLEKYVTDVVTHFKGKVHAWDVVNEVVTQDAGTATSPHSNTNWYQAAGGPEYIDWAFNAARAADPDAKLFINDYNTQELPVRERLIQIVQDLLNRNIPIDGVGHQTHLDINSNVSDVLTSIAAVENLFAGLINHVTELDITVYSDPGSCFTNQTGCQADYGSQLPLDVSRKQAQMYRDLFEGLVLRRSVESVTFWGVSDKDSFANRFPITRTNYPLIYDRDSKPKNSFRAITDRSYVI